MKNVMLLAALASLGALLLIGCSDQNTYTGNGATLNKTFAYREFSSVEISGTVEYRVTQANNYGIEASLPENLTDNLRVSQSGQKLVVTLKQGEYVNAKYRISIAMPVLDRLEVSGTTTGAVTGFNSTGEFSLKMEGTNICSLNGSARHATVEILGTSLVDAAKFQTQTADVNMSGCSTATVNNLGTLNAHIKDLSTLNYIGNPTLADIRVENSAAIKRQ